MKRRATVGRIQITDEMYERLHPTERLTHGRHCRCSACAHQDWAEPQLAPCGMHGLSCPPVYDPRGGAGDVVLKR